MKKLIYGLLGVMILLALFAFGFRGNIRNILYKAQNGAGKISSEAERAIKFSKTSGTPIQGSAQQTPRTSREETPQPLDALLPLTTVKPARPGPVCSGEPITAPLYVDPQNPRYFTDGSGKAVYLTGSHTWASLQDNGRGYPPPVFDYPAYLSFLSQYNHNFFRLWTWEQTRWTLETTDDKYWFFPTTPYARRGPGSALDGKLKFDLTKFDQAYFDRMRERVIQARDCGIYVSVMLFDGWSVASDKGGYYHFNNPWKGHPFNGKNNVNGVNGDPNRRGDGLNTQDLSVPAVTAIQEAYVKKVIDTLNDLDNVLYEIDNEGDGSSVDWQYHMIQVIKEYEAGKPKQHPIGMTAAYPGGWNPDLFDSQADWISPNNDSDYLSDPPLADGAKVILNDTDHLCGVCGDRSFVWKSFTRGLNPIFMDGYDGAGYGTGAEGFDPNDPNWKNVRENMGYARDYANRMDLQAMRPSSNLCSTGYCLYSLAQGKAEFLVYSPKAGNVTVDLSGAQAALHFEWLNLDTGEKSTGGQVTGGANRTFAPPYSSDGVLYIYQ